MADIRIKRVYEAPEPSDGLRVLVDRLWPRGLSRERAAIDVWWRTLAPSDELRRWYHHDVSRWDEFRQRYEVELDAVRAELARAVAALPGDGRVTLVFAATDASCNNAVVLRDVLLRAQRAKP